MSISAVGATSHPAPRVWLAWLAVLVALVDSAHAQTTGILREIFTELPGSSLSDLTSAAKFPSAPDAESIEAQFEAPVNFADNYGQRMRALLVPPTTGSYTFWISGDDQSALFLSRDEDPAHKQRIASVAAWTAPREWTKEAGQRSGGIRLTNGFRYYIEAIQKEGGGGDNLAVRWQLPDGTIEEPLPGQRLVPYGLGPPEIRQQPSDLTVVEGGMAEFSVALSRLLGGAFQWQHQGTNLSLASSATCTYGPVRIEDDGTRFRCLITNSLGSITTREALLSVARDAVSPKLERVGTTGEPTLLTVVFSEPVDPASATRPANYAIIPSVTVLSAAIGLDDRTVLLTTTPMREGTEFTLTVTDVQDLADLPNVIGPGAKATFNLNPAPLDAIYLRPTPEAPGPSSRRSPVTLSEIMYHPVARPDGRTLEFIEVFNSNPYFEDISGWRITGEVEFTFPPGTVLPAHGYRVVAAAPADIAAVHALADVLGPYAGRLGDGGGSLRLLNGQGAILFTVDYSGEQPWPPEADGAGHSLVLTRPSLGESDPEAWGRSDAGGGSPGQADPITPHAWRTVFINELLARTAPPTTDFVELYNAGSVPVDLAGCALTDDPATHRFVFGPDAEIGPLGFLVLSEAELGFALNGDGETLYLLTPNSSRVIDAVRFGAQEEGVALGHQPDGAPGTTRLRTPTPGQPNSPSLRSPVVINEIMFDPVSGDVGDQFVELFNGSATPVDVSGWRLEDGVRHVIPPGTVLPAGGYLVVAREPARLRENHPDLPASLIQGPFDGSLRRGDERVALSKPEIVIRSDSRGQPTTHPVQVVVDEVAYRSGGRWGTWAGGGGSSLELIDARAEGRLAPNWASSDETAKSGWTTVEFKGVLDNGNGAADSLQILALGAGEYLIDDVEVVPAGGANLVANSSFENGLTGWAAQGNHEDSALAPGQGFNGGHALHLRATGRGDTGANRLRVRLTSAIAPNKTATLRARVRWLAGCPEILLRLHGNWIEATGNVLTAQNLGTPGARNSRANANAGPAITDVTHLPITPAAGQPVRVTARVADPDGLSTLLLRYRLDPSTNLVTIPMTRHVGGLFGAVIPAQAAGRLAAFHLVAADHGAPAATSLFPREAPARECLVRWGDPPVSNGFGSYRLWATDATLRRWSKREKLSNRPLDVTFVCGGRVIYNAGAMYSGSPWHAPGFDSPTGNVCDYFLQFPADDPWLGEIEATLQWPGNGGGDNSYQREQTAYWIARQLGLPACHRRHVNLFVNGARRAAYFEDAQQPNGEMVDSLFPEGRNGDLHKIQLWFEFDEDATTFTANGASLDRVTTTGGAKKKARYRWTWAKRAVNGSANNYTNLFALVDTVNTTQSGAAYSQRIEPVIDVGNWLRTYAVEHIVGNNDSYAYGGGQNMYAYKPVGDSWKLMIWDIDFAFASLPPDSDLFNVGGRNTGPDLNHPPFRRLYWQILQDAAEGPLAAANANPILDARYSAMVKGGQSIDSPASIKSFLSQRRSHILGLLATNVPATFGVTSGSRGNLTTNKALISLTGTAPISVRTLLVNGLAWPVTWTSITNWSVTVALSYGNNVVRFEGLDRNGALVPGASKQLVVQDTTGTDLPEDALRFSEIMVEPTTPGGGFIELFNRSTTTPFDLAGWRLEGLDFTFPPATFLKPGAYAVVVENRAVFESTQGRGTFVAGEYSGRLDPNGETLRLVRPANASTVTEVTYDTTEPWPDLAAHAGFSLQLRDPDQDANRAANWALAPAGGQAASPGVTSALTEALPSFPPLWLNEAGTAASGAAWVELFNGGRTNVTLDGCFLSDCATNLARWAFPAGWSVPAGGFFIVWLDGANDAASPYEGHADSPLASTGGLVTLARSLPPGTQLLDYLRVPPLPTNRSFGSFPDGRIGGRRGFDHATPGKPNDPARSPVHVRINEWMAANDSTVTDPADGDYADWFELYNAAETPADLGDYQLAPGTNSPAMSRIPPNTWIPARSHLLVWADDEDQMSSPTSIHARFKLPREGGAIALLDPAGQPVDQIRFGPQLADRSEGRLPDGGDQIGAQARPTPGAPNLITAPELLQVLLLPGGGVAISCRGPVGQTCQLEGTDSLDAPRWRTLSEGLVAADGTARLSDAASGGAHRFFRVRLGR